MSFDHIEPWPQLMQEEKPLKKFHLSTIASPKAVDISELSTQSNIDSRSTLLPTFPQSIVLQIVLLIFFLSKCKEVYYNSYGLFFRPTTCPKDK
jgi:hypothetical protein